MPRIVSNRLPAEGRLPIVVVCAECGWTSEHYGAYTAEEIETARAFLWARLQEHVIEAHKPTAANRPPLAVQDCGYCCGQGYYGEWGNPRKCHECDGTGKVPQKETTQ